MCDYSLMHKASRAARVGDKLVTGRIDGSITKGLFSENQPDTAVCLLPGTEVAFERPVVRYFLGIFKRKAYEIARFTQINKHEMCMHHDALEFPDGEITLVHDLKDGQRMRVLQLPAKPRTVAEKKAQERLAVVG